MVGAFFLSRDHEEDGLEFLMVQVEQVHREATSVAGASLLAIQFVHYVADLFSETVIIGSSKAERKDDFAKVGIRQLLEDFRELLKRVGASSATSLIPGDQTKLAIIHCGQYRLNLLNASRHREVIQWTVSFVLAEFSS